MELKNGIHTKEFKFEDNQGITQTMILRPLPTKYLPKMFGIAGKFNGLKEEDTMKALDEATIAGLVEICVETMKKSYPSLSVEEVDDFVGSHFMALFPAIFELNLGGK